MSLDKDFYTPREAALLIKVTKETLYYWIKRGKVIHKATLRGIHHKRYTIPKAEVVRLMALVKERSEKLEF